MERIEYRDVVDKSDWPRGEWDNEPDKIQWPDEATGLPCLIVRNHMGALCGYVGVSEGHPLYGKRYHQINLEVHGGGLTFSNPCAPDPDETRDICHSPGSGEPDHVWWFGFDCAHAFDLSPAIRKYVEEAERSYSKPAGWAKEVYRNIEYVTEECRQLARQLKEIS